MSIIQTILAILPGIAICCWMFYRDRHNREPILLLIACFLAGVGSSFPAILMERFAFTLGITESGDILQTFILAFGVVGFSEELVKFVCVMLFAYPWKAFDEPLDGIVYTVMVGMGFATIENLIYSNLYGLDTVILRAFTAVPAHAAIAIFMGYHIGLAKFRTSSKGLFHLFLGFVGAVLIHGAYDFFLLQNSIPQLSMLALVILAICIYYTWKLVKLHEEDSRVQATATAEVLDAAIPTEMDSPTTGIRMNLNKKKDNDSERKDWDDFLQ